MNARTNTRTPILRLGAMAGALAAAVVILILVAADSEPVSATQPPPPVYYTLTVNRNGGSACTKFFIDSPVPATQPSSQSVQRTIQAGSQVWIGAFVECPCAYRFDHWEINGEEVDDGGPYNLTMFYLSENTTATAVIEGVSPRVTGFSMDAMDVDQHGTLTVKYTWNSTSGDLSDLGTQGIVEVLTYDSAVTFQDVREFLCTGAQSSSETWERRGMKYLARFQGCGRNLRQWRPSQANLWIFTPVHIVRRDAVASVLIQCGNGMLDNLECGDTT